MKVLVHFFLSLLSPTKQKNLNDETHCGVSLLVAAVAC